MTTTGARIGVIGSEGRMGTALYAAIPQAGATWAGGVDAIGDPGELARACDVLVDFSAPAALEGNLAAARETGVPILVGTTGLGSEHQRLLASAAESIAVLQTGNTSLGVNMLVHLAREAAERLGLDWDIEIAETHHRMKVDAPSGTALMLGEAVAAGRGVALDDHALRGRDGTTGKRPAGAIGFASLRGGSVAGDHTVHFLGEGERLSLTHVAENRAIFARGAVRGAQWLVARPAGRYTMADVLGLG
ncbi:4-hydroxy-tetrahydrodipicolinate reductase [Parablastomonas sp. CN1-191]|uniref:4-hydroxy-tetrahydrodipicolinate reductase n=1 Tax=Parablastomonas sp. CN1-191 TaxID=3400908 RepID=UPI003BF8AFE5